MAISKDTRELDHLVMTFNLTCALVGDKYAASAMLDTLISMQRTKRYADVLYVLSKLTTGRPFESKSGGVIEKLFDE